MTIEDQLTQFIQSELTADPETAIAPDADLLGDGILDSAGIAQLLGYIDDTFQVTVADEDLTQENFETIAAVAGMIASKRGGATSDAV